MLAKAEEEHRALVARRTAEWVPAMTTEGELEELVEEDFLPDQEISGYRVPGREVFLMPMPGEIVTFLAFHQRKFG